MTRLSWDDTWIDVAKVMARRSLCSRDQVGAVIVSKTERIVSSGYNGPPAGFIHHNLPCINWCPRAEIAQTDVQHGLMLDYSDCPALHAEANALSVCERTVREGGTIYVTSHMCMGCAKLVANSGLETVVVSPSAEFTHRNADASYSFLESCGLTVIIK
jgi:dCMP deaminase